MATLLIYEDATAGVMFQRDHVMLLSAANTTIHQERWSELD